MNALLEASARMACRTDLRLVFEAFGGRQREFNWLLTDLQLNHGNVALWEPVVSIQHPLAKVEIVCWDASATLLLSDDDDLTQRFRQFFPEAGK